MRSAYGWVVVIFVSLFVAHACGYLFGVANQNTYFLHALQHAHPELYRHDWLVSSTTGYHAVFSFFAGQLFALDDSGATVFAIVHVVLMVVLSCGVFLVIRGTTTRGALAIFVLVMGWLVVSGERSMAGSYVWSGYLQPSLIGAAGWIIALAMYVRGRPLATGIALAAGGIFHVNFLILGIGAFALVELIVEREQRGKRLALLLAPQLVALAILLPELLSNLGSSDPQRALWVLVEFHAPIHYKPIWVVRELPNMLCWAALAVVVAPVASAYGTRPAVRRLLWWSVIVAAICALGTLIMLVPGLLSLTRLYVWRLAPFAILAAQIVIALALAASVADVRTWLGQPRWRRIAALGLLAWIVASKWLLKSGEVEPALWIAALAIAVAIVVPQDRRQALFAIGAVITLALPVWSRHEEMLHPRVAVESEGADGDALYAWVGAHTSVDAVFLTSPDMGRFRFTARRAIYADFKSPPLEGDSLVEWHARLRRMTGAAPTDKVPAQRAAWRGATGDEVLARSKELGVDYLVLDRSQAHDRIAARPVFSNASFAVYAIR